MLAAAAVERYTEGLREVAQGRYGRARQAFEAAMQAQPDFALAHIRLAEVLERIGFERVAAIHYQQLAEKPGLGEEFRQTALARSHYLDGRWEQAIAAWRTLAQAHPDRPDYGTSWAAALARSSESGQQQALRLLETETPIPVLEWRLGAVMLGKLQLDTGALAAAQATLQAACRDAQGAGVPIQQGDACGLLGLVYQHRAEFKQASVHFALAAQGYEQAGLIILAAGHRLNQDLLRLTRRREVDPSKVRATIQDYLRLASDHGALRNEAQDLNWHFQRTMSSARGILTFSSSRNHRGLARR